MSDTPRIGHAPIPMRRVEQYTQIEKVGDFYWLHDWPEGRKGRVLVVAIPRADGYMLSTWTLDRPNSGGHQWKWNGDEDKPTLTPSLHAVGEWHGWVRDGQLVEA